MKGVHRSRQCPTASTPLCAAVRKVSTIFYHDGFFLLAMPFASFPKLLLAHGMEYPHRKAGMKRNGL